MRKTMLAARIHKIRKPLKIERVPLPKVESNSVLVQVKACGICHSDLNIMEGITPLPKYPMTIGHEFAGVIQDVGSGVKDWKEGQRVCIYSTIACGDCFFCLKGREPLCLSRNILGVDIDGGYAEFVAVPAKCLVELPEDIPFDQGAILTDAVATPFYAVAKRSQMKLGDTVVIFGIGGLGSHAVQIAKISGAAKVIAVDILDSAMNKAKQFGADLVVDGKRGDPVKAIRKATGGLGADVAFEFVGIKKSIEQAIASVRRGGRVVVSGIGGQRAKLPPAAILTSNEIEIVGSFGFDKSDIIRIIEMVYEGKLDLSRSVSHRIALDKANEGLRILKGKQGEVLRIVIVFD